MERRHALTTLTTLTAFLTSSAFSLVRGAQSQTAVEPTGSTEFLRAGACVVLLRHAQTEPGIGDPPEFKLGQCNTQRNLDASGQTQSRRIGQWFEQRNLRASAVKTSPWCRCKDTAHIAFGTYTVLPALGSFFDNRATQTQQTQALRERLKNITPGEFEVWVSHQVNITALTNATPAMGEAFIVNSAGSILARTQFD